MSDCVARDLPRAAPRVLRGERPRAHRYVDPLHRRAPQALSLREEGGRGAVRPESGTAVRRLCGEMGFVFCFPAAETREFGRVPFPLKLPSLRERIERKISSFLFKFLLITKEI